VTHWGRYNGLRLFPQKTEKTWKLEESLKKREKKSKTQKLKWLMKLSGEGTEEERFRRRSFKNRVTVESGQGE